MWFCSNGSLSLSYFHQHHLGGFCVVHFEFFQLQRPFRLHPQHNHVICQGWKYCIKDATNLLEKKKSMSDTDVAVLSLLFIFFRFVFLHNHVHIFHFINILLWSAWKATCIEGVACTCCENTYAVFFSAAFYRSTTVTHIVFVYVHIHLPEDLP